LVCAKKTAFSHPHDLHRRFHIGNVFIRRADTLSDCTIRNRKHTGHHFRPYGKLLDAGSGGSVVVNVYQIRPSPLFPLVHELSARRLPLNHADLFSIVIHHEYANTLQRIKK
jgi:hypothetical protein